MEIRDKTFWILSMVILPFFSPIVYIFRRKNLIHLRSNKFKSGK
ncbi:PLDc N-terminal domain-containing protein [Christiangramia forsetii]